MRSLAGSVLAGVAMDVFGPEGLPLSMFGVFMLYVLALVVFGMRQRNSLA